MTLKFLRSYVLVLSLTGLILLGACSRDDKPASASSTNDDAAEAAMEAESEAQEERERNSKKQEKVSRNFLQANDVFYLLLKHKPESNQYIRLVETLASSDDCEGYEKAKNNEFEWPEYNERTTKKYMKDAAGHSTDFGIPMNIGLENYDMQSETFEIASFDSLKGVSDITVLNGTTSMCGATPILPYPFTLKLKEPINLTRVAVKPDVARAYVEKNGALRIATLVVHVDISGAELFTKSDYLDKSKQVLDQTYLTGSVKGFELYDRDLLTKLADW